MVSSPNPRCLYQKSELVQLKLNIETSVGESTPKQNKEHPLEEVEVSELIKRKIRGKMYLAPYF